MKSTNIRVVTHGVFLFFAPVVWAQQPVSAEPQAPSAAMQAPREVVPPLPVPRLVKFAGAFKNEQGKARTGVVGVTFAVYKEPEGGAALWLETQNVQLDEQGRYTILLGTTKSEGLPLELFATGEPRWLGAQVQLPGEVEQTRVLLVSVPYALKAADADTLGGKPLSAFVTTEKAAGSTGSAIGKPTTSQSIAPLVTTTNVVPKWVDNMGTLGNSQMTDDGTNVNMTGNAGALTYKFTGNAALPTDATATILNAAGVGPVFSGFSFKVRTGAPAPADALSIDPNHNVGIAGNASALTYRFTGNAAPPTDPTATIFNQAFVGPVFSGLSFRVRTGAPMPLDALSVDASQNVNILGGNLKLSGAGRAIVFPDGTVQSTAVKGVGGGTITGVTAGAGLTGGGTTGGVTLGIDPNVVASSLTATNVANPIVSTMTGNTAQTAAVTGTATATGIGNTYGVAGYSSTGNGVGVFGQNNGSGAGVYGLSSGGGGLAMYADGNVGQARTNGGWAKALILFSGFNGGKIAYCFNSTLSGAAATTPPCGFTFSKPGTGDYIIDFGFEVDDRFFSVVPTFSSQLTVCTATNGGACLASLTANQVEVLSTDPGVTVGLSDTKFYLIVY
jgi:type IV secretory pathway VirB2 component (pilin)